MSPVGGSDSVGRGAWLETEEVGSVRVDSTELYDFVIAGDADGVRTLLTTRPGTNLEAVNEEDLSPVQPIHLAAQLGHVEVVRALIERGACINSQFHFSRFSPLHFAALHGRAEVVKVLLEQGAYVDSHDYTLETPLYWACADGHTEVAELLLEAGADVHNANDEGFQALHAAAASRRDASELLELLLRYGAQPNALTNECGRTPLHQAAACGNCQAVRVLLAGGADPNGMRPGAYGDEQLAEIGHCPPMCFASYSR